MPLSPSNSPLPHEYESVGPWTEPVFASLARVRCAIRAHASSTRISATSRSACFSSAPLGNPLDLMCTPGSCAGHYGLGIEGGRVRGRTALGHEGFIGSYLVHLPEEGITAAVLTNQAGAGRAVAARLIAVLGIDERADIYLVRVDGTGLRRLTDAPGGRWGTCVVTRRRAHRLRIDPGRTARAVRDERRRLRRAAHHPRRLTHDLADERLASYAPDGRSAFEVGPHGERDIAVMAEDGTVRIVLARPGDQWHATWSPDGQRLAFGQSGEGIWTMRPDGTDVSHIPGSLPIDRFPVWGPGDDIAFTSEGDPWVMRPDGTARRRVLLSLEEEFGAWWSADATQFVLVSDRT